MEPWYKVAVPRKELREGRSLDPSEFAVHLDQIVNGTAPEEYRDPEKFFARTYFSRALVEHCGMVLRRLSGQTVNTAPVLSLITQFGGGKTHTLAALYHLATNGPKARQYEGVSRLLADVGLSEVPEARVAVFVGNAWDRREGRETPWLDIAWQLAGETGVRLLGQEGPTRAPGTTVLQDLFRLVGRPILLLFDEVLNYIGRYPDQADQFHSFVQNLTTALTATDRAVGLLSLPASPTEMTTTLIEWQTKLTKVVGRVGKPLIATDPEEISEIVRRRLFEDPGRKSIQRVVAKRFAQWVFERRDRLPAEFASFAEDALCRQFEACYPFHPSTLTVFQRKWQSLPSFQQTRGTLAMLGLWIAQAYREGYRTESREPLITLGSAPLYDREFRSKILEQLGETRLEAAIQYDIAGENAHAVALDKESSEGVGRMNIHQRVATALFFESCGGMAPDKAATLPDLRFALGDPDTETTLIDSAVHALSSRCYYLRPVGSGGWRFGYPPTLRKVHDDRKAALDPDDVEKVQRDAVRQVFREKAEVELCFFPKDSGQVPDRPAITLVVMSPDDTLSDLLKDKLTEWAQTFGKDPRQYPGAILWLVPASSLGLRMAAQDLLAWQSIMRDVEAGLLGGLEPHDQQILHREVMTAKEALEDAVWSAYTRLLLWNGKEKSLRSVSLGQMHPSEACGITGAVLSRLRQEALLNREVGASYVERNWPPALRESGAWPLAGLRASFLNGRLTRLENTDDALRQMIMRAVRQGTFGLGVGKSSANLDRVWFKEDLDPAEIVFDNETYLLLPVRAEAEKSLGQDQGQLRDRIVPRKDEDSTEAGTMGVGRGAIVGTERERRPVILEWKGGLPRDKWNLFGIRILPRLGLGQQVAIEVRIRAQVEDPLLGQQLNAVLRELGLEGEVVVRPGGQHNGA